MDEPRPKLLIPFITKLGFETHSNITQKVPSTSHPGINTSPCPPPLNEDKCYSNTQDNYDGDEEDESERENKETDLSYSGGPGGTNKKPHQSYSLTNLDQSLSDKCSSSPTKKYKRTKKRASLGIEAMEYHRSRLASFDKKPENNNKKTMELDCIMLRAHCDLKHATGKRRGVAYAGGESSKAEVALFTLFYFTDVFDHWILEEKEAKGFPTTKSKQILSILKKEIIYSLRNSYYSPPSSVLKLYCSMDPDSADLFYLDDNMQFRIADQFSGISDFLIELLEKALTLPEIVHYTNGKSDLIHLLPEVRPLHDPKRSNNKSRKPPVLVVTSVQDLFETSLRKNDLQLLSIPKPGLFLAMKGHDKEPHSVIIPNIQLDLRPTLIMLSPDETDDDENDGIAMNNSLKKFSNNNVAVLAKTKKPSLLSQPALCQWMKSLPNAFFGYLQDLAQFTPIRDLSILDATGPGDFSWTSGGMELNGLKDSKQKEQLSSPNIFNSGRFSCGTTMTDDSNIEHTGSMKYCKTPDMDNNTNSSKIRGRPRSASNTMDLMAVICYDGKYSCYVRCGQNPKRGWAPWVKYTVRDETSGHPFIRRIDYDVGKWLLRVERHPEKAAADQVPQDIYKMMTTSTFFIYTTKK